MNNLRSDRTDCVILLPDLREGGAEKVALDIAYGLHNRGIMTNVICICDDTNTLDGDRHFGLPIIFLNGIRISKKIRGWGPYAQELFNSFKLIAAMIRYRPKVIITFKDHNSIFVLLYYVIFAKITDTSIIVTQHRSLIHGGGKIVKSLAKMLYSRAEHVIAVSKDLETEIKELIPKASVKSIYNPVLNPNIRDLSEEKCEIDYLRGKNDKCKYILMIGRFDRQKDHLSLVSALELLRKDDNYQMCFIGTGEMECVIRKFVEEKSLTSQIHFLGYTNNPYKYMRAADIIAHSSNWEALPTVLIEALYLRKNIVATDCEYGPREILGDGKFGILVNKHSPENFANAIRLSLGKAVNECGLEKHLSSYEPKCVIGEYINIITPLLERKSRSRGE